ncbi:hypothetical protein N9025_03245 [Synechococcus sp. AH-707-B22]|nr:hypothetical protein [Synechococcus sp. AH-707-B22]
MSIELLFSSLRSTCQQTRKALLERPLLGAGMRPEAPRQTRHYLESAAKREPLRQASKTRNSLLQ